MFVISAEGGGDEQLSEAGIQDKYESGGVGHNRRLRRRNDAANAAELMIEFSLASENGLLMLLRRSGLKRQRLCRWPRLVPRLDPRLPARMTAWGGGGGYSSTSYRQGWRANCIQGRRSRMREPNNGETTNSRHSRRYCSSFPPKAGVMNNVA